MPIFIAFETPSCFWSFPVIQNLNPPGRHFTLQFIRLTAILRHPAGLPRTFIVEINKYH